VLRSRANAPVVVFGASCRAVRKQPTPSIV
jgi:hypothetical protein